MKGKRAGIPRALLYHKYSARWRAFLQALDFEVVCSPATNEGILKEGIKRSIPDICLPVKAMMGHVWSLRGSVDYLFVPRYISVEQDAWMCPKLLGLPDMVAASFEKLPPLVAPMYNEKEPRAADVFAAQAAKAFSMRKKAVLEAWVWAQSQEEEGRPQDEYEEGLLNIGVIGRPYMLFDSYLNKGVIRTLRTLGVNVIFSEQTKHDVELTMQELPKRIYWSLGKEVVSSARGFLVDESIHGIINLSTAACGPDAFTTEIIKRFTNADDFVTADGQKTSGVHVEAATRRRRPYMVMTIDEHAADAGIQTRLEAFVDMIALRMQKRGPLSLGRETVQ